MLKDFSSMVKWLLWVADFNQILWYYKLQYYINYNRIEKTNIIYLGTNKLPTAPSDHDQELSSTSFGAFDSETGRAIKI